VEGTEVQVSPSQYLENVLQIYNVKKDKNCYETDAGSLDWGPRLCGRVRPEPDPVRPDPPVPVRPDLRAYIRQAGRQAVIKVSQ